MLLLALAAGAYFVLRPDGRWAEEDTASMALSIRAILDTGLLAPRLDYVYSNGYGYQAVSVAIMAFTGLPVETLQQVVYPIVSALVVLPAWALYREVTGSARIASLATLLLLLVPEHLFALLRGSHERLDRVFMLAALWLLVRSLRFHGRPRAVAVHLGLVLVATYGLIATNVLFGMSFVLALFTALLLSVVARIGPKTVRRFAAESSRLLPWVVGAGIVLISIFILFLYPPVAESLRALATIPETLANLIFSGGSGFNPYANVLGTWVSPLAFLILSLSNFLLLVLSVAIWLRLGWSWLRGATPASIGVWMLWVLFAAYALQGAGGVLSDRTGALQGNVQYRAFSVFATMAAPILAIGLSRWRPGRWARTAATGAFAAVAVLAILKMTLDPAVSNKWLFYLPEELQGLRWADSHQRGTDTWIGPDNRLSSAFGLVDGLLRDGNRWDEAEPEPGTQTFVVSDVVRLQAAKLGTTMPALGSLNIVYDNGDLQLYRRPGVAAFDQ